MNYNENYPILDDFWEIFEDSINQYKIFWGGDGNCLTWVCSNDENVKVCLKIGNFVPVWWHYTKVLLLRN